MLKGQIERFQGARSSLIIDGEKEKGYCISDFLQSMNYYFAFIILSPQIVFFCLFCERKF